MKFITGLDWSGNIGSVDRNRGTSPLIAYAAVHAAVSDIECVKDGIRRARKHLHESDRYTFKHCGSSKAAREVFFREIARSPIQTTVLLVDKNGWDDNYLSTTTGKERIKDGIKEIVDCFDEQFVANELLLIDFPRNELGVVKEIRTELRQHLKAAGRWTFDDVRPRPDNRDESATVQISDMIAGQIVEHGGIGGSYLPLLESKIRLIQAKQNPIASRYDPARPRPKEGSTSRWGKTHKRFR